MTEEIKTFMDNLASGDNAQAGEAFKDALRAKVASGLDAKRKEMAGQMFNTAQSIPAEAATFSDPKPEVAEPGTFEQDGSVSSAKDGSAEIDLTSDENK
jgi:hypothetical protein|tara:strand:+ start:7138 stop:7434 length:297 start_codon:yes stop_codon:yes gene_type:complete